MSKKGEFDRSMNSKKKYINISIMILLGIVTIAMLVPFIYVSKYSYPFADDFSYGADAHKVFTETRSVWLTVIEAFKTSADTYINWQGTYTSCFLMALQPAVFGRKLYHLTGVILLGSLFLSYCVLGYGVLRILLKASYFVTTCVTLLTFLFSAETIVGIAEAFTWFNGAVHYTFIHSLFCCLLGATAIFLHDVKSYSKKRVIISEVLLCILALIVAGGNIISTFGAGLFLSIVLLYLFLFVRDRVKPMLPITIAYLTGMFTNLLAPGNTKKFEIMNEPHGVFETIWQAFYCAGYFISHYFSWEIVCVMVVIGVVFWYACSSEKILEKSGVTFHVPGLVVLASFCLLAALCVPLIYVQPPALELKYVIIEEFHTIRVVNVIYFSTILLIILDELYLLGWIFQKVKVEFKQSVAAILTVASLIVCVVVCGANMNKYENYYLTSAAIGNITSGTANYYGYQMAENTNRLESDADDVLVMPIGVDPDCLFPFDAEDWKAGTKLFYQKNSVEYESEPFEFHKYIKE